MELFPIGKGGKVTTLGNKFSHIKEEQFYICFLFFSLKGFGYGLTGTTPREVRFVRTFSLLLF